MCSLYYLEIPDMCLEILNHNHQTTHESVKPCLTSAQSSAAGLLGAAPSAAWCCSELAALPECSGPGAAGRGCTSSPVGFPSFIPAGWAAAPGGWALCCRLQPQACAGLDMGLDTGLSPEPGFVLPLHCRNGVPR